MKKITVFLAAAVLAATLCACGSAADAEPNRSNESGAGLKPMDNRFNVVAISYIGPLAGKVYTLHDTVTDIMYIGGEGSFTPYLNGDGEPMTYKEYQALQQG